MDGICLIVSGGDFAPLPDAERYAFVIACDRGYAYAERCGVRPDLLIGDLDSLDGEIDAAIPLRRYPKEKDDTDTMLAVRAALELGFRQADLCCALGGRLDHTIANLQTAVFAAERGLRLRILSPETEITALRDGTLLLPRREGFSLSVFAARECCRGVTLHGTKYELEDAEISGDFPIGVSNEWKEDSAAITVREGTLLVVCSRL